MLDQIFEKIDSGLLTDEVKLEMTTIFEAAVTEAVAKKEEELEEQNKLEIAEFKEELVSKLDEYLNYFVEEFVKENEQQIEESVKVKTATRVLNIFENLVNEFNMKLSDETVDYEQEIEESKAKMSEMVEQIIQLEKEIVKRDIEKVVESVTATLETDAQKEKFKSIVEGITFDDIESFTKKLETIAESIKDVSNTGLKKIDEEEEEKPTLNESKNDRISYYLKQLK